MHTIGLPRWLSGTECTCQCRRRRFDQWFGRIPHALSNYVRVPQLLSLCSTAWELQLLKPVHSRAHALQQEKPPQWRVHVPQLEKPPLPATREKPMQQQRPSTAKNLSIKLSLFNAQNRLDYYSQFFISSLLQKYTSESLAQRLGSYLPLEGCCCSVTQSGPPLFYPMGCSTPGLPVLHHLPELAQTHVHWVSDAIQPSHPLSSPFPPTFNLSQHQAFSQWVSSSHQVAEVLESQPHHQSFQWIGETSFGIDWFDLLTIQRTLKSLLQYHSWKASILRHSAFFMVQLSQPYVTTGKTTALTIWTFVGKVMSLLLNMLSRLVTAFLPLEQRKNISLPHWGWAWSYDFLGPAVWAVCQLWIKSLNSLHVCFSPLWCFHYPHDKIETCRADLGVWSQIQLNLVKLSWDQPKPS